MLVRDISVIGLGKLGSPIAATLASRGFRVIGADVDENKTTLLEQRQAPIFEPGLDELLHGCEDLSATTDVRAAVAETDATFIVVPTPSEAAGDFSLKFVMPVCEAIADVLRPKDNFHLVSLTSTVMPGSTGGPVQEALEKSGKKCGTDFGLCYSPEFVALGSVIHDFLNPDLLLIGESDTHSGDLLQEIYSHVCESSPAVARMNFVSAELAKLALNTYVTTKISFANMLARICEQLPGADVDRVTGALGLDSRIGKRYLRGAISYGGPCFPRDNLALSALAKQIGAPADIAETTDRFNRRQIRWLADLVKSHLEPGGTVGILGLAYKPQSDVVEEASGTLLARELMADGIPVLAFDPEGNKSARALLGEKLELAASAEDCIRSSDVVVVTTPWPEIISLPQGVWQGSHGQLTVIDCWRALEKLETVPELNYVPLGRGRVSEVVALD